jgi:CubicO group peptidase (beta-lactamase class C family)
MIRQLTDRTKAAFIERNARMHIRTLKQLMPLVMLALLALAVLLPGASAGAMPTRNSPPDFAAIDAYVDGQMRELRIPGLALGIVQGEKIVHLQGFGNAGPDGRTVTPQTPFMIGSLSKSMTALAVMQLVEVGKVDLDAPVQRYLPWFRVADTDASTRITVRHLLYQTSGLPRTADIAFINDDDTSEDALEARVRALRTQGLAHPVGTTYEYSSPNYQTLGLIVQQVSGQSYEAYMRAHVFDPLGMPQTFAAQTDAQQHGMAIGYRYWFGAPVPATLAFPRGAVPSGYLISSAEDMAHYLLANLNDGSANGASILSPQGIAELHRPVVPTETPDLAIAMGWEVGSSLHGVPTISFLGDLPNFAASMALVPDGQWGVVLLANADPWLARVGGDRRWFNVTTGVINLLAERPPAAFPASPVPLIVDSMLLLVLAAQGVGIIRSLRAFRRWRAEPDRRPQGALGIVRQVGVPLACNLAWGLIALVGTTLINLPLNFLVFIAPDVGYLLLASGVIALGWGFLRTALAFHVLRKPGATRAIGTPVTARPA